jgi:hypothetical protein
MFVLPRSSKETGWAMRWLTSLRNLLVNGVKFISFSSLNVLVLCIYVVLDLSLITSFYLGY